MAEWAAPPCLIPLAKASVIKKALGILIIFQWLCIIHWPGHSYQKHPCISKWLTPCPLQKKCSRAASSRTNSEARPLGKIFGSLDSGGSLGLDFLSQGTSLVMEAERNWDWNRAVRTNLPTEHNDTCSILLVNEKLEASLPSALRSQQPPLGGRRDPGVRQTPEVQPGGTWQLRGKGAIRLPVSP